MLSSTKPDRHFATQVLLKVVAAEQVDCAFLAARFGTLVGQLTGEQVKEPDHWPLLPHMNVTGAVGVKPATQDTEQVDVEVVCVQAASELELRMPRSPQSMRWQAILVVAPPAFTHWPAALQM